MVNNAIEEEKDDWENSNGASSLIQEMKSFLEVSKKDKLIRTHNLRMVIHLMIIMKNTRIFGEVSEGVFNEFIVWWTNHIIEMNSELLSYEQIISYYMMISDEKLKIEKVASFLKTVWLQLKPDDHYSKKLQQKLIDGI